MKAKKVYESIKKGTSNMNNMSYEKLIDTVRYQLNYPYKNEHKKALKILINKHFEKKDPNFWLNLSARSGYMDGVIKAIKKGANIRKNGNIALAQAVKYKEYDIAELLLKNGARPSADVFLRGDQPVSFIKNIVKYYPSSYGDFFKKEGNELLMDAINKDNLELVNYLVKNMKNKVNLGWTEKDKLKDYKKEKLNESLNEEYMIGAFRNEYDNSMVHVYKNPRHIQNFDPWVRGISDDKGNLYLAKEATILHGDLQDFLEKQVDSYKRNGFNIIDWQRKGDTYDFYVGESWGFDGVLDADDFDKQRLEELMDKVQKRNPHFNFQINKTIAYPQMNENVFKPKSEKEILKDFPPLDNKKLIDKCYEIISNDNFFRITRPLGLAYDDEEIIPSYSFVFRPTDKSIHEEYHFGIWINQQHKNFLIILLFNEDPEENEYASAESINHEVRRIDYFIHIINIIKEKHES